MLGNQPFEDIYENLIVQPSTAYRSTLGLPVHLDKAAFEKFLYQLKDFRQTYPNMAFWMVIDYKSLTVSHSDGDATFFGHRLASLKDFYRQMHPSYLLPVLRWRSAAYELIFKHQVVPAPLESSYRQIMPLRLADEQYHWFNMNSTILQVDSNGHIVTYLQTFNREGLWSLKNLRPVEASVQIREMSDDDLHQRLTAQMALKLIDEFTDAELDLLSLYASNNSTDGILKIKNWSRHTIHEYNANLMRKARDFFVYDFRNARSFAEFCQEKGYLRVS